MVICVYTRLCFCTLFKNEPKLKEENLEPASRHPCTGDDAAPRWDANDQKRNFAYDKVLW